MQYKKGVWYPEHAGAMLPDRCCTKHETPCQGFIFGFFVSLIHQTPAFLCKQGFVDGLSCLDNISERLISTLAYEADD